MIFLLVWAVVVVGAGLELRSFLYQDNPYLSTPGSPRVTDIKVLFIGNSLTFFHEMPLIVAKLAASKNEPRRLYVRTWAPGGTGLIDHANDSGLMNVLRSGTWDVVVMQERSEVPSVPAWRADMLAGGKYLQREIRQKGAKSMLYETWDTAPALAQAIPSKLWNSAPKLATRNSRPRWGVRRSCPWAQHSRSQSALAPAGFTVATSGNHGRSGRLT